MRNAAVEIGRALSAERRATFLSVLSLGVKMGFTQPLRPLSSFVLSRNVATICFLERVGGSRSVVDSVGTIDPKLAFPS